LYNERQRTLLLPHRPGPLWWPVGIWQKSAIRTADSGCSTHHSANFRAPIVVLRPATSSGKSYRNAAAVLCIVGKVNASSCRSTMPITTK